MCSQSLVHYLYNYDASHMLNVGDKSEYIDKDNSDEDVEMFSLVIDGFNELTHLNRAYNDLKHKLETLADRMFSAQCQIVQQVHHSGKRETRSKSFSLELKDIEKGLPVPTLRRKSHCGCVEKSKVKPYFCEVMVVNERTEKRI